MRREVRSARPPLFRGENFLYGSDYGRDRRFRAQSRLGSDGVFNESSRTVCYAIKGTASRFEIRADNGRFFLRLRRGSRRQEQIPCDDYASRDMGS